jgi:serine/threonine-protein kinase
VLCGGFDAGVAAVFGGRVYLSKVFRGLALAVVLSLTWDTVAPSVAHAQPTPADRAAAETLFNDAVKLLEAGNAAGACPKLEESQRLDPGVGTLLYLADCYKEVGRTASAWATFREASYAAHSAGQYDRETTAAAEAEALLPKLTYVVFNVAAADTPGLEVKRDGQAVGKALWETQVPMDPGEHQLEVSAPKKKTWTGSFAVADVAQQVTTVPVPALEDAPPEPVVTVGPQGQQGVRDRQQSGQLQRTMGWVTAGAGVVGLGLSGVFALMAVSDHNSADEQCLPTDRLACNAKGVELGESAVNKANVAGVMLGVGGVLAATGVILIVTAPSDSDSAQLSVGAQVGALNGVTVKGAF